MNPAAVDTLLQVPPDLRVNWVEARTVGWLQWSLWFLELTVAWSHEPSGQARCPVEKWGSCNSGFNPDSVHGLLGNSVINFSATFCHKTLLKYDLMRKMPCLLFMITIVYVDCVSTTSLSVEWLQYNDILEMEILCHRYLKINNLATKYYFVIKFGVYFADLLGSSCTKFYSDSFTFDISTVHFLRGYVFFRTPCITDECYNCIWWWQHVGTV